MTSASISDVRCTGDAGPHSGSAGPTEGVRRRPPSACFSTSEVEAAGSGPGGGGTTPPQLLSKSGPHRRPWSAALGPVAASLSRRDVGDFSFSSRHVQQPGPSRAGGEPAPPPSAPPATPRGGQRSPLSGGSGAGRRGSWPTSPAGQGFSPTRGASLVNVNGPKRSFLPLNGRPGEFTCGL